MYFVYPSVSECYYLRLLLNIVCGATSFINLCTVNSILYPIFKDACTALGLLDDDAKWDQLMPERLWKKYFTFLTEDIHYQNSTINESSLTNTNLSNEALLYLLSILNKHSKCLEDFPNMPLPTNTFSTNLLITEELNYNIHDLTTIVETELSYPEGTGKTILYNANTIEEQTEAEHLYPVEFLNSLLIGGLPLHKLILKSEAPIILLRNINPSNSLCNRTRLICQTFQKHVIEAEIMTSYHSGNHIFLLRIIMSPSNTELPFTFKCQQFPIQPAFALTINKSQGQTLSYVGLYLLTSVFFHSQLYIACFRVTSHKHLKVLITNSTNKITNPISITSNIVYPEVC
ncbi:12493_t:CDS:2 [Cetraspora pellucida]|uniref:12493_t:CDS:1 n=1 Tax=Cetraspora pellucida TaxID=1433469 RepID=A0A9N8ZF19_9GLOM|nr:12493_t:CDS:2 [Cetraspora pellucida]